MKKDEPRPKAQKVLKRLERLIRLKKDVETLRELKKSIPPKEPILPS